MAVIYAPFVKTSRMTAVRDAIDSGGAAGRMEICTAGYGTVLATITLGYSGTSTGTITNEVLTLTGFPRSDVSADAGGTAVIARIRTSAGEDVVTGLVVDTAVGEVILTNTNFTLGQQVTINSASFTHGS
jgi:hypothetical protein